MTRKSVGDSPRTALAFSPRSEGAEIGPRSMSDAAPRRTHLPGPVHRDLRAATRSDHVALDALVLKLNLTSVEDYGRFLRVHHSALQRLEADWRDEDRHDFTALLNCARSDLKTLKISAGHAHQFSRKPVSAGQRLGIAYVLRESRLGAHGLRLRIPSSRPSSYVDHIAALSWPLFLEQLDPAAEAARRVSSADAIRGARFTFDLYANLFAQAAA
jgi:heme oxygenase